MVCSCLIVLALINTSSIALQTKPNVHPDELVHVDAFRFFEDHWWPPPLGSDEVIYSLAGWSRVYEGEVVYLIYGKIGRLVYLLARPPAEAEALALAYQTYRFLNVLLYGLTLACLFFIPTGTSWPALAGFIFVCVPQVNYIYAYANSDAWSLSVVALFFLWVLAQQEQPFWLWSWSQVSALGILTALVFLTKQPYWLSLAFLYPLIAGPLLLNPKAIPPRLTAALIPKLAFLIFIIALIAGPLQIIYPLSQGDFASAVEQMREEKAREEFKPSNPTRPGLRLAAKGAPFKDIALNRAWIEGSTKSFYGLFGYFNVHSPRWVYGLAAAGFGLLALLTYWTFIRDGRQLPYAVKFLLLAGPVIIVLNVLGSMYNSWQIDFQPQGRYLFPSLVPLSIMLLGTVPFEKPQKQWFRFIILAGLYLLCLYTLYFVVLSEPKLIWS